MIASCVVPLVRTGRILGNKVLFNSKKNSPIRHSMRCYAYRSFVEADNYFKVSAGVISGALWWWVFWFLLEDYHELFGEGVPDPSTWTDEELGIPPL